MRPVQLDLLDHYAGVETLAANVREAYHAWRAAQDRAHTLETNAEHSRARITLLESQLGELAELAVAPGEYEDLHDRFRRQSKSQDTQSRIGAALTVLDDVAATEAAQALGRRMMREGGTSPAERITYGFRLAVARLPKPDEQQRLVELYERAAARFHADAKAAQSLAGQGSSTTDTAERAAWPDHFHAVGFFGWYTLLPETLIPPLALALNNQGFTKQEFRAALGVRVKLSHTTGGKGKLTIHFTN